MRHEVIKSILQPRKILPASEDDKLLAFQLKEWVYQNAGGHDAVNKKTMVDGIIELRQVRRWDAYKLLKRLWRCGLATRMGEIDSRSDRPKYQSWKIN